MMKTNIIKYTALFFLVQLKSGSYQVCVGYLIQASTVSDNSGLLFMFSKCLYSSTHAKLSIFFLDQNLVIVSTDLINTS